MKGSIKYCEQLNPKLIIDYKINKYLDVQDTFIIQSKYYDINDDIIKESYHDIEIYNEDLYEQSLIKHY